MSVTGHSRLARTLSPSRWKEYGSLLQAASDRGYAIHSLEDWLLHDDGRDGPTLLMRHDVDQHPRSVLTMLEIEQAVGAVSTWYFRWRTADPSIIRKVRAAGGAVGLHFETLTRAVLRARRSGQPLGQPDLEECRAMLRREVDAFAAVHGTIKSVAAHGDTRVPGVSNGVLVRGVAPERFGVLFDANERLRWHRLAVWLTDRSAPDGRWSDGLNPFALFEERQSPILCLTHPNNWVSGVSLWGDRLLSAALPHPRPGTGGRAVTRTVSDAPPFEL